MGKQNAKSCYTNQLQAIQISGGPRPRIQCGRGWCVCVPLDHDSSCCVLELRPDIRAMGTHTLRERALAEENTTIVCGQSRSADPWHTKPSEPSGVCSANAFRTTRLPLASSPGRPAPTMSHCPLGNHARKHVHTSCLPVVESRGIATRTRSACSNGGIGIWVARLMGRGPRWCEGCGQGKLSGSSAEGCKVGACVLLPMDKF